MRVKECRYCGKEFEPTASNQQYCSSKCWKENYKKEHPYDAKKKEARDILAIYRKNAKLAKKSHKKIVEANEEAKKQGMSYGKAMMPTVMVFVPTGLKPVKERDG